MADDVKLTIGLSAKGVADTMKKISGAFDKTLNGMGKEAVVVGKNINKAFKNLDVRSFKDINREVKLVQASLNRLKASGKVSMMELARVTQVANARIKALKNEASGVGAAFDSMKGSAIGLGIALYTVKRAVDTVIESFSAFDDTMRLVKAVSQATEEEYAALTATARKMGISTRYSPLQAAEGLKFLAMAGMTAHEAIAALPGVLQLATVGNLDLGEAADIATNILTGYGLEVSALTRVNDILVHTFTSTNSTLSELGTAFSLVGPIAAAVEQDFEGLNAAIGMLHNAGLKGSMAGTALRGALGALLNPTDMEAALMKSLGERLGHVLELTDKTTGKFVGFKKVIEQLEDANIGGAEALALFGERAGPGMAALIRQGSDALGALTDSYGENVGKMAKISEDMEAGIGGALRNLKSAMQGLTQQLGEGLAPAVMKLAEALTWLSRGIIEVDSVTKYLVASIGATVAGITLWKVGLGAMLSGFKMMILAINAAAKASAALTFGLTVGLVGAIIYTGIQGIRLAYEISLYTQAMMYAAKMAKKEAAASREFADSKKQEIKTRSEIRNLTKEQRKEYEVALISAMKFWTHTENAARMAGKSVKEAEGKTNEYTGALINLRKGTDEVGVSIKSNSERYQTLLTTARETYNGLTKAVKKYAQDVIAWEEKIHMARMSTEDKLRALKQKGMEEEAVWVDKRTQAEEKMLEAQKMIGEASAAEDEKVMNLRLASAQKLVKGAESLFADLAREIKTGAGDEAIIAVPIEEGIKVAQEGIKEVGKVQIQILELQAQSSKDGLKTTSKQAEEMKLIVDDLVKKRDLQIDIELLEFDRVKARLQEINSLSEPVTKTVTVKTVSEGGGNQSAGAIGARTGRYFPGYGGGDRIPIMGEAGEYMLRKEAVRAIGVPKLDKLNALKLDSNSLLSGLNSKIGSSPLRTNFATGGPLEGAKDYGRLELSFGGGSYPIMGDIDVIENLKSALVKESLVGDN